MTSASIIIPVYNAEAWLERCLDSGLAQSPPDAEFILVDDGSSDKSAAICAAYAARDKRIIALSQKNMGAPAARNHGLDMARGEYVLFVDADDYISHGYIHAMLNTARATGSDIAYCNVNRMRGGKPAGKSGYAGGVATTLGERLELLTGIYFPAPYAKIYRNEFLAAHRPRFLIEDGYHGFAEDLLFSFQCCVHAAKIAYCGEAEYFYTADNPDSACNNPLVQPRNNEDRLIVIWHMLDFCRNLTLEPGEYKPLLQVIDMHLEWGGPATRKKFHEQMLVRNAPDWAKSHFSRHDSGTFSFMLHSLKSEVKKVLYKAKKCLRS